MGEMKRAPKRGRNDRDEAYMEPMPAGPYIRVTQWDEQRYSGMPWDEALKAATKIGDATGEPFNKTGHVPLGYVVLACVGGMVTVVAHRYDSGD
jgi:hypothetical protein